MRLATKARTERQRKIQFWLNDGMYDFRDQDTWYSRMAKRIDPVWNRQEMYVEMPGRWVMCQLFGHQPEDDQCMIPSHRYCIWCGISMPNFPVRDFTARDDKKKAFWK